MVDAFLIITVIIMSVVLVAAMVLILIKFGHPNDKNEARFPKVVTIFGLWLAFASVLILPYDVANTRGTGGGLDIAVLWQIVYIALAAMIAFVIPFAYFYYESDVDDEKERRTCCETQTGRALAYTIAFFIVFTLILVCMYAGLNRAKVPVIRLVQDPNRIFSFANGPVVLPPMDCPDCRESKINWTIPVTFPVYTMAFLSFLGWFFFSVFVGVGLMALPLDLINEYRTRPKPIATKDWFEQKKALGVRVGDLIVLGEQLREILEQPGERSRSERWTDKGQMRRFEQNYYLLKKDYTILDTAYKLKGGNPLWPIFKCFCGCLGIILSLTWVIHIALFLLPEEPVSDFLNTLFIELEFKGAFPLFGVACYAMYSFYLLWCCVKGNFKLGLRFLFWKVYPLELNNTMMNSFLANTWIVLLCSVPTVQFCVQCFPVYARYTAVDMLFGTQIQHLEFFTFFWDNNVFVIAILALAAISCIWLIVHPVDKEAQINKKLDNIRKAKPDRI